MIESFRDRDTERLFHDGIARRLPADIQRRGHRLLRALHVARRPEDMGRTPGAGLERLAGNRAGQWSVRVNERWRLCFEWRDGSAYDVEIVDYHR